MSRSSTGQSTYARDEPLKVERSEESACILLADYLAQLLRQMQDKKIEGIQGREAFNQLKSVLDALPESSRTDFQELNECLTDEYLANAKVLTQSPNPCRKCGVQKQVQEIKTQCGHQVVCFQCFTPADTCVKCQAPSSLFFPGASSIQTNSSYCVVCHQGGSNLFEIIPFTKIHFTCLVTRVKEMNPGPLTLGGQEMPDQAVLNLLKLNSELTVRYKREVEIIVQCKCPNCTTSQEVDMSMSRHECQVCYFAQCPLCPQSHSDREICAWRDLRQSVQDYIEAGATVIQCPYCHAPNEIGSRRGDQTCQACEKVFLNCCSCKKEAVEAHGNKWHRRDCTNYQGCHSKRGECSECPKLSCREPPVLKTKLRYRWGEK